MRLMDVRPARGLVALALLLAGGCLWPKAAGPAGLVRAWKPAAGPVGDSAVALDVAVIEQPVGDGFLNRGLWLTLDEGVVELDRKAVLEDNGFRVALTGGIPPDRLQDLLVSERSNPDPRQWQTRAGTVKTVALGGPLPRCAFQFQQGGGATAVELEQGQCQLAVTPALTADGQVRLTFVPQVQHGEPQLFTAGDDGDWQPRGGRPVKPFPALTFEVTLGPQEYVVVGTDAARDQTLGHRCFVTADGPKPVQRLLAIRAGRLQAPADPTGAPPAAARGDGHPASPSPTPASGRNVRWSDSLNDPSSR